MKKIFYISITMWLLLTPCVTKAYDPDTHAALTQEAVLVFNQYFEKNLTQKETQWLIQGSIEEDRPPRILNHFFDPINNRGLIFAGRQWPSAKEWSQSMALQISAIFNPPAAVKALFGSVSDSVLSKSDFTWQKAISEYKKGNTKEAFIALGHVLHLIEDVGVPAHTRNDIHFPYDKTGIIYGGDDPYESYCEQFDLTSINMGNKIIQPIILASLDDYFNGLAKYTNTNFYSKDTIGFNNYALPAPLQKDNLNRGTFLYQQWSDGQGLYPVAQILSSSGIVKTSQPDLSVSSNFVLSTYWERLSEKAIEYSAGVINLFFQEVEPIKSIAKEEYLEEEVLGVTIELEEEYNEPIATEPDSVVSFNGGDSELTGSSGIVPEEKAVVPALVEEKETGPILIAELFINMVGTDNSEYIKLYNPNDFEMDISEWSIQYLSGTASLVSKASKKNFIKDSIISPKGTYLIGLKSYALAKDMGWSRSLGNSGATVVLVNDQELIVSEDDNNIIDALAYGEISGIFLGETKAAILPQEGSLLKRLALVDGECISNRSGDLAYGCDTNNNYHDFESNKETTEEILDTPSSTSAVEDEDGIPKISYLKDFQFYEADGKYFVDLSWSQYPFITKRIPHPSLGEIDAWHVIVFYLNQKPEELLCLGEGMESHLWGMMQDISGTVRVKYNNCKGNLLSSSGLILPDTSKQCSSILDMVKASSLNWEYISDKKKLTLQVDKRDLNNPEKGKDYITFAYYAYHPNANFNSNQRLIAIDPNKYYLK